MSTLYPYKGHFPLVDPNTFLAPGARVIGDVTLAEGVSIWYNVVVRGDVNHIAIGKWSNIQDNTTVHADSGRSGLNARSGIPTIIGDNVTVGHNCILHACTIEDCCLIGMGAVILDGAYIGRGSVIGAGALVLKGTVIPPSPWWWALPPRSSRRWTRAVWPSVWTTPSTTTIWPWKTRRLWGCDAPALSA